MQARAARLLAAAIRTQDSPDKSIVSSFLEWLTGQLRRPSAGEAAVEVATSAFGTLLRDRDVRQDAALQVPLLVRILFPSCCKSFHHCMFVGIPAVYVSTLLQSLYGLRHVITVQCRHSGSGVALPVAVTKPIRWTRHSRYRHARAAAAHVQLFQLVQRLCACHR